MTLERKKKAPYSGQHVGDTSAGEKLNSLSPGIAVRAFVPDLIVKYSQRFHKRKNETSLQKRYAGHGRGDGDDVESKAQIALGESSRSGRQRGRETIHHGGAGGESGDGVYPSGSGIWAATKVPSGVCQCGARTGRRLAAACRAPATTHHCARDRETRPDDCHTPGRREHQITPHLQLCGVGTGCGTSQPGSGYPLYHCPRPGRARGRL